MNANNVKQKKQKIKHVKREQRSRFEQCWRNGTEKQKNKTQKNDDNNRIIKLEEEREK